MTCTSHVSVPLIYAPRGNIHHQNQHVGYKSYRQNTSREVGQQRACSSFHMSSYRPHSHMVASSFVHLKIGPDYQTHFFETHASWYLILRLKLCKWCCSRIYKREGTELRGIQSSPPWFSLASTQRKGEWGCAARKCNIDFCTIYWKGKGFRQGAPRGL